MLSAAAVASAVTRELPTTVVQQQNGSKLWLLEHDEPYAEVLMDQATQRVTLWFSVHCAPATASIVTGALAHSVTTRISVSLEPFIQDYKGQLRYGPDAEAYWKTYKDMRLLLSPRFSGPPS